MLSIESDPLQFSFTPLFTKISLLGLGSTSVEGSPL